MDWDRKAGTILTVRHLSTVEQAKHERKEKKINLTEEKSLGCLKFYNQDRSLAVQVPGQKYAERRNTVPDLIHVGRLGTTT